MVGRWALRAALLVIIAAPLFGDDAETLDFLRGRIDGAASAQPGQKPTDWAQANEERLAFTALIALYQGLLSSQDGAVCSFSPSCSQYSKQVIERYGLFPGLLMASDRFQRCNGWGALYYPRDSLTGRLHDPLP